jgi:hypothetical protein
MLEADLFSGKNVSVGIECQIATTASLWAGITFCKPKVAIKVSISTFGVRPFVEIDTNDNTQPLSLSLGANMAAGTIRRGAASSMGAMQDITSRFRNSR